MSTARAQIAGHASSAEHAHPKSLGRFDLLTIFDRRLEDVPTFAEAWLMFAAISDRATHPWADSDLSRKARAMLSEICSGELDFHEWLSPQYPPFQAA